MKEESEKSWPKTQNSKTKIMASGSIASWEIDGETVETVSDFIFWELQNAADGDCSHEIKRSLHLGRKVREHIKKQSHHFADMGPYS